MDLNKPQTLIVLGPSGCGKGTQIKLIKEYLAEQGNTLPVVHLVMGDLFRAFWETEGYSRNLSRSIQKEGGLQPAFMQIRLWSQFFVDNISGNEHIIIDGSPRRILDAKLMESAFDFYKREKPTMIYTKCDRSISIERIKERADRKGKKGSRAEDRTEETIKSRMDWFDEFVVPAIDYFRDKDKFNFVEIDGNVGIQEVFAQIKEKLLEEKF